MSGKAATSHKVASEDRPEAAATKMTGRAVGDRRPKVHGLGD